MKLFFFFFSFFFSSSHSRPDLSGFKKQALTKAYFSTQILCVFGIKHTEKELDVLFNYFDKDGDGT